MAEEIEGKNPKYTEQGLPKEKKVKKPIAFGRFGIRFKIAFGTFFFLMTFFIFFLIFSNQYSQDILSKTYDTQAENIFDSVKSEFQDYLSGQFQHNYLLKYNKDLYNKMIGKSGRVKRVYQNKIKNNKKKIKENLKYWDESYLKMKEKMDSISKQRLTTYQTKFSLKNYKLIFHSNIYNLPNKTRYSLLKGQINGRNQVSLSIKDKSNKTLKKIIDSHKRSKLSADEKKYDIARMYFLSKKINNELLFTTVKDKKMKDYINYNFPVYAKPTIADYSKAILELFQNPEKYKISSQLIFDFKESTIKFEKLYEKLIDFEVSTISNWAKDVKLRKKNLKFSYKNLYRDKEMKKTYIEFLKLKKKRKEIWKKLRSHIIKFFDNKINEFKEKMKIINANQKNGKYLSIAMSRAVLQKRKFQSAIYYFSGLHKNYPAYLQVFHSLETGWKRKKAMYIGTMGDPQSIAKIILSELFGGVANVEIFLYDIIKKSEKMSNQLTDMGIAFILRSIFLVFLLAGFFVKDIKSLAITAKKVEEGDLDAQFKVSGKDELKNLADTFNQMMVGLKEKEEMRMEIHAAGTIQRNLLPQEFDESIKDILAERIDFAYDYRAMTGVGGDYVDIFPIKEDNPDKLCIVNADVSNHGVGPGLVMTMMRSSLHALVKKNSELKDLVSDLNKSLFKDTPPEIFVTLFIAYLDTKTGEFEYISCGHNIPYIIRNNKKVDTLPAGGMALGAMMPMIFDPMIKVHKEKLNHNEYLFQYTDGYTEAFSPQGDLFGDDRLLNILTKMSSKKLSADKMVQELLIQLEQFTELKLPEEGPTDLTDDVAIAFVGFK